MPDSGFGSRAPGQNRWRPWRRRRQRSRLWRRMRSGRSLSVWCVCSG